MFLIIMTVTIMIYATFLCIITVTVKIVTNMTDTYFMRIITEGRANIPWIRHQASTGNHIFKNDLSRP